MRPSPLRSAVARAFALAAKATSALAPGLAARFLEQLFLRPLRAAPPQRERAWLEGATTRRIACDDRWELPVYTWEPLEPAPPAAPVALLVHGWSGRGSQLGALVAPLQARGYRVVAFDAPGHGAATGTTLSGLPWLARAIEAVADAVGGVDLLVAHSLGAAAATMALSRGLLVRRAVFLSPPDDPSDFPARQAARLGFPPSAVEGARARIERRFGTRLEDVLGAALAPRIRVPLLVLHDPEDTEIPFFMGQRLAGAWPGARLEAVSGLGHYRILRDPAVVARTVAFLADEASLHADASPRPRVSA